MYALAAALDSLQPVEVEDRNRDSAMRSRGGCHAIRLAWSGSLPQLHPQSGSSPATAMQTLGLLPCDGQGTPTQAICMGVYPVNEPSSGAWGAFAHAGTYAWGNRMALSRCKY